MPYATSNRLLFQDICMQVLVHLVLNSGDVLGDFGEVGEECGVEGLLGAMHILEHLNHLGQL